MKITILGSGTATPLLHRNASGILVHTEEAVIAVDMGPGVIRRLCEAGVDTRSIDVILLTHFHADHVSDVAPFLFASNYAYGPVRSAPFWLVGPRGLKRFFDALVQAYGSWVIPSGDRLILEELDPDNYDELTIKDATIKSVPAPHSYPSLSYRIESQGASVTISGDTDVSDDLVALAERTDCLICECSLPGRLKFPGHLTPPEAGAIAQKAHAKRLILTHFYPPCDETDVVQEAATEYRGEIVKAYDHLVIEV
ncbi:MAG: MBL fold metallo-hydrolase [Desulfomonilaceae bacterium]